MSIRLESENLINTQQMEVGINGPDGATHLILCTGVANLPSVSESSYTFLVGPQLSRRQFVGAIASGALAAIQSYEREAAFDNTSLARGLNLVLMDATYDDEFGQVKVNAEVSPGNTMTKLAISYSVSILVELPFL